MDNTNDNNQNQQVNPVEEYVKELKEKQAKERGEQITENVRPDFLLPQFKNIEEQAKSYKELQALQTKQAQELAKYKKNENMNVQNINAQQQLSLLQNQAALKKQQLNSFYLREIDNLEKAVRFGKITPQEAKKNLAQLENLVLDNMQKLNSQYENSCSSMKETLNMVSPKEFFQNDVLTRNYLSPIIDFLENNYKKLPKKELENVKNLIQALENSLREEILNETKLTQDNNDYRGQLYSTTNLNSQNLGEKIYTLEEIKKMKPEEFRKNQKTILEQFVARKIK